MAAKKKPSFVRTTISIPADLRRRMQACGEAVNWSAVAAEAFRAEVARINVKKEGATMAQDIIDRLRASKREQDTATFAIGRKHGIEWAQQAAQAYELRRLEKAWEQKDAVKTETDWLSGRMSEAETFVKIICPGDAMYGPVEFFREEIFGCNDEFFHLIDEPEYIHGFARGALDIWEAVAEEL